MSLDWSSSHTHLQETPIRFSVIVYVTASTPRSLALQNKEVHPNQQKAIIGFPAVSTSVTYGLIQIYGLPLAQ